MRKPVRNTKVSTASVSRGRGTVVDLLCTISNSAVPGHLISDIDMSWVSSERELLRKSGRRVTITAFIMKAIALAQRNNPESRTEVLPWGRRVTYDDIVGGFTVEREVMNQVSVFFAEITDPDSKSVTDIATEINDYSKSALDELPSFKKQTLFSGFPTFTRRFLLEVATRLPMARLAFQKSTFGLTSLGKYGIQTIMSPCICTSTFTVGAQEDRAIVFDGVISIRPVVTLCLSFDQRVMDPILASSFMHDVKDLLEGGMRRHFPVPVPVITSDI